jgi:hypothetical protein
MTSQDLMDKLSDDTIARSEFYKEFSKVGETKNKLKCIELLMKHYNCGFDEAREVMDFILDGKPLPNPDLTPQQIAQANAQAQDWLNKVHCPYCNSTNVTKISTVDRVVSTGLFGLASKKIGKQWHCNECKSNF